jgi:hypothetical protein
MSETRPVENCRQRKTQSGICKARLWGRTLRADVEKITWIEGAWVVGCFGAGSANLPLLYTQHLTSLDAASVHMPASSNQAAASERQIMEIGSRLNFLLSILGGMLLDAWDLSLCKSVYSNSTLSGSNQRWMSPSYAYRKNFFV